MINGETFEISFPEIVEVFSSVIYDDDFKDNYFTSGAQRSTRCCDCDKVEI